MTRETGRPTRDDDGAAIPPSALPTLSSGSDLSARQHFEKGYQEHLSGRHEEAIVCYQKAIDAKSMYEAFFNMGLCLKLVGRLTEAEAALARSASLNRLYRPAYKVLSEVQKALGKESEAQVSWSQYSRL
jgi:tetratricopeptide (TPR) repeat protein